jgi:hypothetical protein
MRKYLHLHLHLYVDRNGGERKLTQRARARSFSLLHLNCKLESNGGRLAAENLEFNGCLAVRVLQTNEDSIP